MLSDVVAAGVLRAAFVGPFAMELCQAGASDWHDRARPNCLPFDTPRDMGKEEPNGQESQDPEGDQEQTYH
jgi:hypothetical protein